MAICTNAAASCAAFLASRRVLASSEVTLSMFLRAFLVARVVGLALGMLDNIQLSTTGVISAVRFSDGD